MLTGFRLVAPGPAADTTRLARGGIRRLCRLPDRLACGYGQQRGCEFVQSVERTSWRLPLWHALGKEQWARWLAHWLRGSTC